MDEAITTDYDVDIAEALGKYLRPKIHQGADGSLVPMLAGIPSFLAEVHRIVEAKLDDTTTTS
jgi:hypothetical protein